MKRIGFIGTGLMGQPMARCLLEGGYPLTVWNRTTQRAKPLLEAGAVWADSPKTVAQASDVVITMVTDSKASEEVICGKNGVLQGFDACLPIFEKMGSKIVYVGENGAGTTLKLINNLILGIAIEAVAEAFVLARKVGIDPQKVIEITSVGGARTGAMETRGPRMARREFSPHFSTNNMYKDLSSVMKLAEEAGVSLPAASISTEMLRAAKSQGKGDLDSCVVMTVLEGLANIT
jgi:3-hydroxyisobutyrate dehydrogenase-like beta-hydroxyacid dehydrogenase